MKYVLALVALSGFLAGCSTQQPAVGGAYETDTGAGLPPNVQPSADGSGGNGGDWAGGGAGGGGTHPNYMQRAVR